MVFCIVSILNCFFYYDMFITITFDVIMIFRMMCSANKGEC